MGQYTSEMTASRRLVGGPQKAQRITGSPFEKVVSMYPVPKEDKHTPMMYLMKKSYKKTKTTPKETNEPTLKSNNLLKRSGRSYNPATTLNPEVKTTGEVGSRQHFNAYTKAIKEGRYGDIQKEMRKNKQ